MRFNQPNFIIYDIETSGLDREKDSILSLSALKIKNGEVIDELDTFIFFDKEVPQQITEITGINTSDVSDSSLPTEKEAIEMLKRFSEDVEAIGGFNNLSFDDEWLQLRGFDFDRFTRFDVYEMVQFYNPYDTVSLRLEQFAPLLGINVSHESLADCKSTFELLKAFNAQCDKIDAEFGSIINTWEDVLIETAKSANNRLSFYPGSRVTITEFQTNDIEKARRYRVESMIKDRKARMFTTQVETLKMTKGQL